MAGNYDVLSTTERVKKIEAIVRELQLCKRSCMDAQKIFDVERKNAVIHDWLTMWDEIEDVLDNARAHAGTANQLISNLTTFDSPLYKNFAFQYEWRVGWGGIRAIEFSGTDTIKFLQEGYTSNYIDSVPTGEVTADDLILIENAEDGGNNGLHTISSVTASSIVSSSTFVNNAADTTAIIRVVRRTV